MKLSEEQNAENANCTLDKTLNFVLADGNKFEELNSESEYEDDILKKCKTI